VRVSSARRTVFSFGIVCSLSATADRLSMVFVLPRVVLPKAVPPRLCPWIADRCQGFLLALSPVNHVAHWLEKLASKYEPTTENDNQQPTTETTNDNRQRRTTHNRQRETDNRQTEEPTKSATDTSAVAGNDHNRQPAPTFITPTFLLTPTSLALPCRKCK